MGFAVCIGASASVSFGQDMAAAEALFREGKVLLDRGELEAACTKLAASQELDPSSGTLLNLATCHERQGRTATAWAEFLAAARLAQTQGRPERVAEGKKRAAALEPALSYMVITVTKRVPGLAIRRDDTELDAGTWGSRIPIDPGPHALVASAAGYDAVELHITIGKSPEVKTVIIPELRAAAAPSTPTAAPTTTPPAAEKPQTAARTASPALTSSAADADHGAPNHTVAYVVGGLGGAALIAGGIFGGLAMSAYSRAKEECPTKMNCNEAAMSARDSAATRAMIADVGIGVGVVGLGVASVLYFTAGDGAGSRAAATFTPYAAPSQAGFSLEGAF
ncbi:MAG: hypothetical protein OZ921_21365 [Sorangiineae bacterium]|nr:hypothetical protein [Sorangiineae bacterium]